MAADPHSPHSPRTPRAPSPPSPRAAPRAPRLAAALALALAAHAAPAPCAAPAAEAPLIAKPALAAKRVAPTLAWQDGPTARALTVDPGLQADFTPGLSGRPVALRASAVPLKDVSAALQSPVLRDESGRARALPGGVIVTFAPGTDDAAAVALLALHGATVSRRLSASAWLVEAPAGLAALELANRLAATGAFVGAQPNWWVERALK